MDGLAEENKKQVALHVKRECDPGKCPICLFNWREDLAIQVTQLEEVKF